MTRTPPNPTGQTSDPTDRTPPTRWEQQWAEQPERWQSYADKFATYYADGTDMDGEARFVDMLAARDSVVLDAGCGTGRVAAGLAARGHRAIGVDKDAGLVRIGIERYPLVPLLVADLADLAADAFAGAGVAPPFDLIVSAGNVMVYAASGTEPRILTNLDALLAPGGRAVFGFATDRDYTVDALDADSAAVGWLGEHRFATWHLDPYAGDSDWAVSVFRKPGRRPEPTGPDGRWAPKG
ncbi:class I SAM-dependent methyltransferase [Nakamurella lactea]|uniref:class I SAM-dependent methyltransferase n=1 Tax=Nakamurella lactea TaxID=459515 RepID=UPI00040D851D|nr:class I SAM-dependent methyltransferase [Nakamurella lactea]